MTKDDSVEHQEPEDLVKKLPKDIATPKGMVWIPGGTFMQGTVKSDEMAMHHEKPAHPVAVDGFFFG